MKEQTGPCFCGQGRTGKAFLFSLTSQRNEAVNIPSSPSLPGSVTKEKRREAIKKCDCQLNDKYQRRVREDPPPTGHIPGL
jgi:hypothetical protein